ncbi:DUF151 domain-containing protein [Prevotella bivia]|uniref:UvrB/UvrC motif-containing protein n=1 Tax=Prevotella bivia TaxID=28125 RepID=UPI00254D7842|nr:bifunctional nuclease domain-containing protein [Prevotella bivia]MDK7762589.1 DUF151 domain-containing protein [Prevotella bivia]
MDKVKLLYSGITQLVDSSDLYLIVLENMEKTRQIAIVCNEDIERELAKRLVEHADTSTCLPEVMCLIHPMMNSLHYEILISGITDGNYKAFLINKDDLSYTPIRVTDAILIALVARLEIYIDEQLFRHQSCAININTERVALPINALNTDMLKSALDKAIASEDYESASYIRDELNRRNNRDKA